ncbi:MAG: hypothetical protein AVDCRST_MAG89-1818, partial [uncultured Gemmatimonadetes bacterium]
WRILRSLRIAVHRPVRRGRSLRMTPGPPIRLALSHSRTCSST